MKTTTITYSITADEETHNRLVRFLKTASVLGDWGCSRILCMHFDGDGPSSLSAPGLSNVAFDREMLSRETESSDDRVDTLACVPGRGALKAFVDR